MGWHMWREETQSTFYMSKMKDIYSHNISQAWNDIAIGSHLEKKRVTLRRRAFSCCLKA